MVMSLKLSELKQFAPQLILSGVSFELVGPPGCGKTEFCEQMVEHMGKQTGKPWGFSEFNGSTAVPTDIPGFLLFGKVNERGTRAAEYTEPTWMTCRDGKSVHDYEHGILLIDERRSADPDIKKALASLILNKRVGNHVLPPGWSVWSTGNRTNDRSGATKDFDFIINRHCEVHIRQDIEDTCDIYAERGVHPAIIAFCNANPQVIMHDTVPEVQGPWATPRSMELAARILQQFVDPANPGIIPVVDNNPKVRRGAQIMGIVSGIIGEGAANQLVTFLKMANSAIQFSDIVNDPIGTPLPERPDTMMLVCYSAAARVDMKTLKPAIRYIERLPEEFAVMFTRAALKRDANFINTQAMGDWCAKNASLLAVVTQLK